MRLEINGVVCGLITQESEEYMQTLAGEVGEMMKEILAASPFVTREAAALTAALSYCDDAKKNGRKAFELQERVDELEVEAELWQEEKEEVLKNAGNAQADEKLAQRITQLEEANTRLEETAQDARQLAEQVSRLEDENAALRQVAAETEQPDGEAEALRQRLTALEAENSALKAAADEPSPELVEARQRLERLQADCEALRAEAARAAETGLGAATGAIPEEITRLESENRELREKAEEQAVLARKAEQEKQGAVSAAKRAVEEARKVVDQLQEEAERARDEVRRLKARGTSPALDLLERTAEESGGGDEGTPSGREASPARKTPAAQRKKRNPLRYEEDFEQEGFVSFFEKK